MQPFSYAEANSLHSAIELAAAEGATLIAGGTDVLQLLQEDVLAPPTLIGIGALPLAGVAVGADGAWIGAMARLAAVADDARIQQQFPLLAQALLETASPQVRNMATVGGNLLQRTRCLYFRDSTAPCNKRSPASGCSAWDGQNRINAIFGGSPHCIAAYPGDMGVALVALDATVEVHGRHGPRHIKVADLHMPPGDTPAVETTLRPGEIITAIQIPPNDFAATSHYLKVRDRASFEWALVSVAVALQRDGDTVRAARIVAGGVGTTPWRLPRVEAHLVGHMLDVTRARAAAAAAIEGADPRPGNTYKVRLLQNAIERAVLTAGGLL
jgi:xanthine dehydrogenase YagS FAD-binding subunit